MDLKKQRTIEVCKFLKEHNALERFCYNAITYHKKFQVPENLLSGERTLWIMNVLIDRVSALRYPRWCDFFESCDTCFSWCGTPEGEWYWRNLHSEWYEKVTEQKVTERNYGDDGVF